MYVLYGMYASEKFIRKMHCQVSHIDYSDYL